jgi:hypothetical protein
VREYGLDAVNRLYRLSGSNISGGFGITTKVFLEQSPFSDVLTANSSLAEYKIEEGYPVLFKNRYICWVKINAEGRIVLPEEAMKICGISPGDHLLSIRSSNIAIKHENQYSSNLL